MNLPDPLFRYQAYMISLGSTPNLGLSGGLPPVPSLQKHETSPGEDRQRFVVPTGHLSHPLFKMLLEKAYNEFGFKQMNGLVVPCTVTAFQEVGWDAMCASENSFPFKRLADSSKRVRVPHYLNQQVSRHQGDAPFFFTYSAGLETLQLSLT